MTRKVPQEKRIEYNVQSANVIKPVKYLEISKPEGRIQLIKTSPIDSKEHNKA